MSVELRQLRYAVATADAQSFSRAAAALNVKQSTLSRRVLQLEDRLGVKLFERTTRGAEPTESGRAFIEKARRIVADVENLQTTALAVRYGEKGRIAIGYCSSLMAGPLKLAFADYLTRFPDVQCDGVEGDPKKLLQSVQSRTVDVAIAPAGLKAAAIKSCPLWSERLMVALLGDNWLIPNERIYWQDLRREVFVVSSGGLGPIFGDLLTARLTEQGHRPSIVYQDTSLESVLAMVSVGRFITIVTEASQGVNWPDIHFREIYETSGPARLEYALYWCDDNENPALKHFFKLLKARYPTLAIDRIT